MNDVDKVRKAMNCFNKLEIEVQETDEDLYTNQKGKIIQIDKWINLVPLEVEEDYKTIVGIKKHKVIRWDIEVLVQYWGDRDTPPDIDYQTVSNNLTLFNACKEAWSILISNTLKNVFENIEYEENMEHDEILMENERI